MLKLRRKIVLTSEQSPSDIRVKHAFGKSMICTMKRRDLDCGGITDKWGITVCQGGELKFDPRTATECEKPLYK
jgi:hypothetical protein